MKKIIFLLFTCLTTLTFSQTKSFQINWKGVKTLSLETSDFQVPQFNKENFNFFFNDIGVEARDMCWNQGDYRFYYYYKKWQKKTYHLAKRIIQDDKIDLIHQLNMIGYREPGYLWKINDN